MLTRRAVAPAVAVALSLAVAACGSAEPAPDRSAGDGGAAVDVVAAFYPLQYVAERIGGDRVRVSSLTEPGAEPHDLELTPQDVATISDAGLVAYLSGFQPAVDEAVAGQAADRAFDAAPFADLDLTYTPIEDGEQEAEEAGATDPHFWLDPTRLRAVADQMAERLTALDSAGAATYAAGAADLAADLEALDTELRDGLRDCRSPDLVTSHNAFGYLADRYGLEQVGITGLTPADEPDPQQLARVTTFVRDHDVSTIYYETLVSPAVAETVARETGAGTAVLDPLEGLGDDAAGQDYLSVMRSNLATIQQGQGCR